MFLDKRERDQFPELTARDNWKPPYERKRGSGSGQQQHRKPEDMYAADDDEHERPSASSSASSSSLSSSSSSSSSSLSPSSGTDRRLRAKRHAKNRRAEYIFKNTAHPDKSLPEGAVPCGVDESIERFTGTYVLIAAQKSRLCTHIHIHRHACAHTAHTHSPHSRTHTHASNSTLGKDERLVQDRCAWVLA